MNADNTPCYIARCLCGCGALRFAAVDDPKFSPEHKADTAESIAEMIKAGYSIERMPVDEVRFANWTCAKEAKS